MKIGQMGDAHGDTSRTERDPHAPSRIILAEQCLADASRVQHSRKLAVYMHPPWMAFHGQSLGAPAPIHALTRSMLAGPIAGPCSGILEPTKQDP